MSRQSSSRRPRRRGFTLMEVLLVVAILIILAALSTVAIQQAYNNARRNTTKLQIKSIQQAIDTYYLSIGNLPPSLDALLIMPDGLLVPDKWQGPYLKTEGGALPVDAWNQQFFYQILTDGSSANEQYVIYSVGKDGIENTADDIKSN